VRLTGHPGAFDPDEIRILVAAFDKAWESVLEIAPELTGHGLPLVKCEAYNRVYDQPYGSS
jgi:hypothetical protein